MTPSLSIVIVNFNGRAHLEACLASLTTTPPAVPHDIIVVDNASSDDSVATVRHFFPQVEIIAQDRNAGFAAANNAGIRATTGDLVLLLNNDTIVPPGSIDALVKALLAHPDAAVAGPRLIDANGTPELSFGRMISPFIEVRQKLLMALHERQVPAVSRWVDRETRREQYVDWVTGACLLVHRKDAEEARLLDERFFIYTEDVDFCAAIRALGRRVLFTPVADVVHLRGRVRVAAPVAINAAYRRSHVAFYEKHHPRWAKVLRLYLRMKGQAFR